MKRQALLALFALISLVSFGQESPSSVIRGAVVDAQSDFPLPGVTVLLIGSDPVVGTTTDIDGRFRLVGRRRRFIQ